MFLRLTQHFCEGSSKSSSRWVIIGAEIEPQRWPCWNHFTGSRQLAREGCQQGTWQGGAVVNPQLIVATFCVEVGKLHFDKRVPWHADAPNTALSVGIIFRVVRACKLPDVLSTDGRWASWKRKKHLEVKINLFLSFQCVHFEGRYDVFIHLQLRQSSRMWDIPCFWKYSQLHANGCILRVWNVPLTAESPGHFILGYSSQAKMCPEHFRPGQNVRGTFHPRLNVARTF